MECGVESEECGVRSVACVKCKVWSAEWKV